MENNTMELSLHDATLALMCHQSRDDVMLAAKKLCGVGGEPVFVFKSPIFSRQYLRDIFNSYSGFERISDWHLYDAIKKQLLVEFEDANGFKPKHFNPRKFRVSSVRSYKRYLKTAKNSLMKGK